MKKLLSILVLATLCFSTVAQKTAKHYSMDVHGLSPEAAMALLDLRMGKTLWVAPSLTFAVLPTVPTACPPLVSTPSVSAMLPPAK
jgi:hypothetical protein